MSILYLGGISVGNTMSFRRQRMSSTYSRIGQTDTGHNCGTDTKRLDDGWEDQGLILWFTRLPEGRQSPPLRDGVFLRSLTCAVRRALGYGFSLAVNKYLARTLRQSSALSTET